MAKQKITMACFLALGMFIISQSANAGTAHITWNSNTEPDLDGYKVYYDTSSHAGTCPSGYAFSQDVGKTNSFYRDDLTPGQTYYFQITAYDTSDVESACSTTPGEVSRLINFRSDMNESHGVNLSDLSIFAAKYGKTSWCGPWRQEDINRDCTVDANDANIMAGEYGQSF